MNALETKLTPDEAGKQLGVNRSAISGYIRKGYLKATNVGDGFIRPRWQIDQDDLDYFIHNKDEIVPKTKRGSYRRKPKTAESETSNIKEVNLQIDHKYVNELLQENRSLRKKIDELKANLEASRAANEKLAKKNKKLVNDMLEVLSMNE